MAKLYQGRTLTGETTSVATDHYSAAKKALDLLGETGKTVYIEEWDAGCRDWIPPVPVALLYWHTDDNGSTGIVLDADDSKWSIEW